MMQHSRTGFQTQPFGTGQQLPLAVLRLSPVAMATLSTRRAMPEIIIITIAATREDETDSRIFLLHLHTSSLIQVKKQFDIRARGHEWQGRTASRAATRLKIVISPFDVRIGSPVQMAGILPEE